MRGEEQGSTSGSVSLVSDEVCDNGSPWTEGCVASVFLSEKVTTKTRHLYLQSEDYHSQLSLHATRHSLTVLYM